MERREPPSAFLPPDDLARLLKRLASLYDERTFGDVRAANSLRRLSELVRRYGVEYLDAGTSQGNASSRRTAPATASGLSVFDGRVLHELSLSEIEELISHPDLRKSDLIRIANERFAIARSVLQRQSRDAVVAAIRAGAQNEQALGVIAEAARDDNLRRT